MSPESHIQLSRNFVSRLQLPERVWQLIENFSSYCSSIALGGSWARGDAKYYSDVDLCLITLDSSNKRQVLSILSHSVEKTGKQRILIDAKVFTEHEFQSAIHSHKNLFLYTFFLDAHLLYGKDVGHLVIFISRFLRETLWIALKEVEEAISFIEQEVMLDVACYKLWTALNTFYIANQVINKKPIKKTEQNAYFQKMQNRTDK